MQLDQSTMSSYLGGEIEVQNQKERYIYHGGIKSVAVNEVENELTLELSWVAKAIRFPPVPIKWVRDDAFTYTVNLDHYSFLKIGRLYLWLNSYVTGEVVYIYPPDAGGKFDQSLIQEPSVRSLV